MYHATGVAHFVKITIILSRRGTLELRVHWLILDARWNVQIKVSSSWWFKLWMSNIHVHARGTCMGILRGVPCSLERVKTSQKSGREWSLLVHNSGRHWIVRSSCSGLSTEAICRTVPRLIPVAHTTPTTSVTPTMTLTPTTPIPPHSSWISWYCSTYSLYSKITDCVRIQLLHVQTYNYKRTEKSIIHWHSTIFS